MSKEEKLQARVETEIYERVREELEDRDQSQAEFIRQAVQKELRFIEEGYPNIRGEFFADIGALGRDPSRFDLDLSKSPARALATEWATLQSVREDVRPRVLDSPGPVYITGQGSSLAAGKWLTQSLREDRDTTVHVSPATDLSPTHLPDGSVVLVISRSGQTESVVDVAQQSSDRGLTTVALTRPDSGLEAHVDHVIPLPTVAEQLTHYSKQTFVLQVATLYTVLVATDPTESEVMESFEAVDKFLATHLTQRPLEGEVTPQDHRLGLLESSQFRQTAQMLLRNEDIHLDPVISGVGHYRGHCPEMVQKCTELLYRNAVTEHLGSVRDRLLNLLYAQEGYLLVLAPHADSDAYQTAVNHVFKHDNSIENLLRYNADPVSIPLITMTFNDPDLEQHHFERDCKRFSRYETDQILTLPQSESQFTNDLILFVAVYLFTAALLEELWNIDKSVRKTVIRRAYPEAAWETDQIDF